MLSESRSPETRSTPDKTVPDRRQTAPAAQDTPRRRRRLTGGVRAALVVVLGICTAVAGRQRSDANPFDGATLADAFFRQRETNAFRRGPVVRGTLLDVYATPGGDRIWAVGSPGLIALSTDGGSTWTQGRIETPEAFRESQGPYTDFLGPLRSVWFTSDSVGWIAGDNILLRSGDGGRTWQKVPGIGKAALNALHFVNASDGWAVGDSVAFRTGDGAQWNRLEANASLTSVQFTSRSVGWAVDRTGGVLRTENGVAWKSLPLPPLDFGESPTVGSSQRTIIAALSDQEAFAAVTVHWTVADSSSADAFKTFHFYTSNGGVNWQPRERQEGVDLSATRFFSASEGIALNRSGAIYRTTDGARSWTVVQRLPIRGMTSMYFPDRDHGFAVGAQTVWATSDAGRTWRYLGGGQALTAAHFFNERRGVTVGQNGFVASTNDGGRTWAAQDAGVREDLHDVAFTSRGRGWAVGAGGSLLFSPDRGRSWHVLEPRFPSEADTVSAVHKESFVDLHVSDTGGWAAGSSGAVLRLSGDGKVSRHAHIDESLSAIDFVTDSVGWALGRRGLWQTRNAGATWSLLARADSANFQTIEFLNEKLGWAAAGDTILRTTDGGYSWAGTRLPAPAKVLAIRFASPHNGWAAGRNGHVWTTRDGGITWTPPRVSGFDPDRGLPDLIGLANFSDTLAWAVGEGGTVVAGIRSRDWTVVSNPPIRGFPGWWVFAMMIGGVLLFISFRTRSAREVVTDIDDMFATDRPLQGDDPDRFDFDPLARGISRFLRNEETNPPLTVAITGPWGAGKTSLMNLTQADLTAYGHRTVWFNAWDHNEEEQLLASLLASVQAQAIPKIVRPEQWLWFRLRLFWVRMTGRSPSGQVRPAAYVAIVSLAIFLGWAGANVRDVSRILTAISVFVSSLGEEGGFNHFLASFKGSANANGVFGPGLLLVSGLSLIVASWKTFRVFGLNPSKVATSLGKKLALRDTAGTVGYRHRFAEDFGEMVRALDGRLVIFVDDLDRCEHDCVYRVLEAVNFLNSAGECLVVLGMDRDLVRASLARHFNKAAKELKDIGGEFAASEFSDPVKFTDQFIEKLINIEIPVPRIENGKLIGLVTESVRAATVGNTGAQRVRRRRQETYVRLAASFFFAWLATYAVVRATSVPLVRPAFDVMASEGISENSNLTAALRAPASVAPPVTIPADADLRTSAVLDLSTPISGRGALYFGFGVLLLSFMYGAFRRPPPLVNDPPDFVEALNAWSGPVAEHVGTPRRMKRYLNRLRYYAMLASDPGDAQGRGERAVASVRTWFRPGESDARTVRATSEGIPQPVLVGLASIEACRSKWLTDTALQTQLRKRFRDFIHENLEGERFAAIRALDYPQSLDDKHWEQFKQIAHSLRAAETASLPGTGAGGPTG